MNRWDTVRDRLSTMAEWGRENGGDALEWAGETFSDLREGVVEKRKSWREARIRQAARKLLEDDDEFSDAVKTLRAHSSIYDALAHETDDIWRRARLDDDLIGLRAFYVIGLVAVVIGAIYALSSAWSWLMHNWSGIGSVVSGLAALFASAYTQWFSTGQPDRWVYLFGGVALLVIAVRIMRATLRDLPIIRREWVEGCESELRPRIRVELNKLTNKRFPRMLPFLGASGLGETSTPYRLITRKELDRIKRWSEELGASAIAISGSRGVGKTTLLRSMISSGYTADRDTPMAVFVAAPVTYDAREFLILLYSRLCEEVIGLTGPTKSRSVIFFRTVLRPIINILRRVIRFGLLALLAWIWLPLLPWGSIGSYISGLLGRYSLPVLHSIRAAIFSTAVFLVLWWLSGKLHISRPSLQAPSKITRVAEDELRRMHLLQTVSIEASVGVKRGFFDLGGKHARQLAERPSTLPELVESYRQFAEQVASWLHSRRRPSHLLICIDEVDRISKAEDAESFINDVKAIFGVKHCVYLVTVSEEALAGFERRVVRLRPALDSAFDEVLRLDVFKVGQSLELLRRHVVGFADVFISLCHCLAGGIPRDLVREARALLDATLDAASEHASSDSHTLKALTAATVTRSVTTLKRGLVTRTATAEGDPKDWESTLPSLVSENWPGDPGDKMFESLTSLYAGRHDDRASLELCAAVFFYATVYDVFTQKTDDMERDLHDEKSEGAIVADRLAAVRGLLALSPTMVIEELNSVRRRLSLPELVRGQGSGPSADTTALTIT
jgi:GTPase SAR1 family protein